MSRILEFIKTKIEFKKIINIIFIIIFILFLSIPSVFRNRIEGIESKYEKRYLEKFPNIVNKKGKFNEKYFEAFDAWASDNLWNRDTMINKYSQWMYDIFGIIRKDSNFMLGKNREVFFTGELSIDNYSGKKYIDDKTMEDGIRYLKNFEEISKTSNGHFYYLPMVDKEVVKPEFFPKSVNKINEKNAVDEFVDKVKKETDINVYYPKELMLKSKEKYNVYARSGDVTHWTDRGAYIAYVDFMKKLCKDLDYDFIIKDEEDFDIKTVPYAAELYGGVYDPENVEVFRLKESFAEPIPYILEDTEENNTFEKMRYVNNKLKDGKNILIVGDSYMYSFWLYYLQESFHNTVYLHFTKQYFLPQVMLIYKPDIVIFENASREFFLNTPNFKELANYMEGLRDLLKGNK